MSRVDPNPDAQGLTRGETVWMALIAIATVLAGFLHYSEGAGIWAFVAATAALGGIAWLVSFATEQLGERMGPAATGLMQSTLGNLPEFFVVVFALAAGKVVVAQTAVVGSILANALLVLGLAIVAGSLASKDKVMRFSTELPNDTATLSMAALFTIAIVSIAVANGTPAADNAAEISFIAAILLLLVYSGWVVSYVKGGAERDVLHQTTPRLPAWVSVVTLAVAGVGAAFVSDWFVAELDPAIDALGISEAFAGLVIVAIAGNAIENATGVIVAARGKAELAVSVVKHSIAQIAAFLFPLLVLVSFLFDSQLTFAMPGVLVAALAVTAIVVWQITNDGKALLWEGLALIAIYGILAAETFYS